MRKPLELDPLNLNKRFVAAVLAIFGVLIIIGLFAGCGEDNPTNNNNNPPVNNDSLIWSIDTMTIWTHNPTVKHFQLIDTTTKINKFKILLNFTSNADSCCGNDSNFVNFITLVYPFGSDWYTFNRANLQANPLNLSISFSFDNFTDFKHDIYFGFSHTSPVYPPKFIKLNKFELYITR